ncbi:glycosyltransferase family 20-domain-containing protein [Sporodiniella umbellata]|nr:glycosyltransferase family 20-domain-containing protein [Sporodiniella umbellata]
MALITEKRVVVATLFLPWTVDFKLLGRNEKQPVITKPAEDNKKKPNLIESLTCHPWQENKEELFDFKKPDHLVQPRTKQQRDQANKKLSHLPVRKSSPVDSPQAFADAPWSTQPSGVGNIGLNNALFSIQEQLQSLAWVGTLGMPTESLSEKTKDEMRDVLGERYSAYPVMPSDTVFEGHYNTYCKQVLWPYFHYVVRDDSHNMMSKDDSYQLYRELNQQFADTIVKNYREGDIIWINDYHLMLVPGMIREKLPNATVGFFLHIPFPSSELFRCLPARKELLEAMLQSDVIGFQTYSFARHFLQTCSRILSVDATPTGIQLDTHYCSVGIHPIGIDLEALNRKILNPEVSHWVTKLKEKYGGKRLIVARDKLDYIKGVRQKLLAFEQFLTHHPEWREKVVLIQIALSTSEQNELRAHISDVVSRVNFRFSTISYQPIVFLHQDISFSQYLALLTCADTCLLTPLRDGMNLTSHEYIACQKDTHNPLILSEFTGTYGSFGASLRVNPWDYRQIGEAIHDALSMHKDEKTARWKELYKSIESNSAQHFATEVISHLSKAHNHPARRFSIKVPKLTADLINESSASFKRRLFLLDYGGTLIPHGKPPGSDDIAKVLAMLTQLASDPKNVVYVISGRTKIHVDTDLGSVANLGLSAENGFYIKPTGGEWEEIYGNVDFSWKPTVKDIFQYYTERTPGAYVESKDTSIVWHYRTIEGADSQYVTWQAAECQNHIADSVNKNFAVHTVIGNTSIEVVPHEVNKSLIANRILQDVQPDFVLSIGDDRSDEDVFTFLNKQKNLKVITCKVGKRGTEAKYYIPNVDSVLSILEDVS